MASGVRISTHRFGNTQPITRSHMSCDVGAIRHIRCETEPERCSHYRNTKRNASLLSTGKHTGKRSASLTGKCCSCLARLLSQQKITFVPSASGQTILSLILGSSEARSCNSDNMSCCLIFSSWPQPGPSSPHSLCQETGSQSPAVFLPKVFFLVFILL